MTFFNHIQVGTYWESKRAGQFAVEVRSVHTLNYVTIREMSVSLLVIKNSHMTLRFIIQTLLTVIIVIK